MSMPNPPDDQIVVLDTYGISCVPGRRLHGLGTGLGMAYALTMYTIFVGGFLLIAGGAIQLIVGIFVKRGGAILMNLACGLLYLVAGVFAVSNPEQAAIVLTWLLSVALIVTGIARMVLAFLHRQFATWLTLVLSGFVTMLIGVYILNRWPWDSDWVIGLFFAIDLISQGLAWLILGVQMRMQSRG